MKNKTLLLLLGISFAARCLLAGFVELNNDEVYYWTYAQHLQWNYFDHPPFIAFLLRITTVNLFCDSEFFLRLGPVCCGTLSTWLVYLIGKKLNDTHTGLVAAFLFTASFYGSIICGFLVIPDAPEMVFWLWSLLLMLAIADGEPHSRKTAALLPLLGFVIGACMLSKLHGVFLWVGFGGFIIGFRRGLLKQPALYLSVMITAVMMVPVLLWNMQNHFASYSFHSNRVALSGAIHAESFFRELAGEIAYNNPVNLVLLGMALTAMLRKKWRGGPAAPLFLFTSLPLILLVLLFSLHSDTLPHWTGPAYTTLIPLTASWLSGNRKRVHEAVIPGMVKLALAITCIVLALAVALIKWAPFSTGGSQQQQLGANDITLDMSGWRRFGVGMDSLAKKDVADGVMKPGAFLIADYWFPAAHIDYYAARPFGARFIAVGDLPAIHHYAWLNLQRPFPATGSDAYFIAVSNYFNPPAAGLERQYEQVMAPVTLTQYRAGRAVRYFYVYRMKHYRGGLPRNGVTTGP